MKKSFVCIVLVLFSFCLFAQSPRLISMGNVDGYISDDSDIFTYPATIHNYGNTVYGYLSNYEEGNNFGFNYQLAKSILGVYLNKPLPEFAQSSPLEMSENIVLDHYLQMFLGFNEYMACSFSLALDNFNNDENEYHESASAFGLGFGYSYNDLDFGINLLFPTYKQGNDNYEIKLSKFLLDIDIRNILNQKAKSKLIGKTHLGFGSQTLDDDISGTNNDKKSYFNLSLGLAEVVDINDKNLLVLGITPFACELQTNDYGNHKNITNYFILPAFNIGFESQVCKWLVLRSGFEQAYYIVKASGKDINGDDYDFTEYDNDFVYNMGIGMLFKNFTIDYVFNKEFLHNGPNFITGEDTSNLFGRIMVEYKF